MMKFETYTKDIYSSDVGCATLIVSSGKKKKYLEKFLPKERDFIQKSIKIADFHGNFKESLFIPMPFAKYHALLLIGAGSKRNLSRPKFHQLAQAAALRIEEKRVISALISCELSDLTRQMNLGWQILQLALAVGHAHYRYYETRALPKDQKTVLKKMFFSVPKSAQKNIILFLEQASAVSEGMNIMRNMANLPGNLCTPAYIEAETKKITKKNSALSCTVLTEKTIKKMGMGAFMAVSQGSREEGRIVCIEYQGDKKGNPPVALVGKGITFDTGGISIKPSATMDEMKFDMSGAASVIGAIVACCSLKLKLNIVGVMACAENMPGSMAAKPGDIVKTMSGQTVEILNTDAEGRLVLCDALTYVQRYRPQCIIDIATLTGACLVALGNEASGLMSNNQKLANDLLQAGETSCDRCWQLPLWDEYNPQLHSNFADVANIGGRYAGTITAASFLSRFVKKHKWAHLDIAGVAWTGGKNKGSTGRPVGLLTEFLITQARRKK